MLISLFDGLLLHYKLKITPNMCEDLDIFLEARQFYA